MGKLGAIWRIVTGWYISLLVVAAVGILLGYFVFYQVYPGKPKIGIIGELYT